MRSLIPLVLLVAPLASCKSYPERTEGAFRAFQGGHFANALELYADPEVTDAPFLEGAESGTVALVAGQWDRAQAEFHKAAASVEGIEERALVSTSALSESLASWALNDRSLAYRGEGFERVYVHCCLAMTYLAQGLLDDVLVEVRRANKLLEAEEELYETEYQAGGVGHFLSALTYELLGQYDDAYIDYRRMVEKGVGTEIAGRSLVRIANERNWGDEVSRWEERFGPDLERPEGAASIVVLAGLGVGPRKKESRLILPTGDGVISMAVPSYVAQPQSVTELRLRINGVDTVRTSLIEDVVQVAETNLSDRLAWMAAKSVARGIVKRELTKKLEEDWALGGRVLGDLFSIATERADLRAWQTLPGAWHAARMFVPPGVHEVELEALGGERVLLGAFELQAGETMLIFARSLSTRLYAHAIGGTPATNLD